MKKTQSFIVQNSKWQILEDYIIRIEGFSNNNAGLVIENCKSLIESIFKTILVEIGSKTIAELKKDDIGKLNKQVRKLLNLKERGYSQIIGSFSSAISQFRNELGETSHGKDIYTLEKNRSILFDDEVEFLLATTDNVSFFLLSYYTNLHPFIANYNTNLSYEDNTFFNNWFDDTNPVVVISGAEFSPSKILFEQDTEIYKENLLEYQESESK